MTNWHKPFSTREQKIVWLLSHAHLWENVDWDSDVIITFMKKARLLSWTTAPIDVKLSTLIDAARERLNEGGWYGKKAQAQVVEEERTQGQARPQDPQRAEGTVTKPPSQEALLAARALHTTRLLKASILSFSPPSDRKRADYPHSILVEFADARDAEDFFAILLNLWRQTQQEEGDEASGIL